ncbi:hypothetical protein [Arthrobacter sp. MMS18-M83]|uniref:hypothetical protein n=1 Tax=Arthrobacter sp. MMS18-M83 TaxID=2996261 RepID=UPI00227B4C34|nr:hypothetical protein [Arthrobacter sp. MMS18-M83]WAH97614.1 hypothetical protein OW521_01555 [Arthrobacter sp. MMS18-M83]
MTSASAGTLDAATVAASGPRDFPEDVPRNALAASANRTPAARAGSVLTDPTEPPSALRQIVRHYLP